MLHENEVILSISDKKKMRKNTRDIPEVLVNNIGKNVDINIDKNEKLE